MWKLDEGENIVKVLRRHYWVMLPTTILLFVLAIFPALFVSVVSSNFFPIEDSFKIYINNFLDKWQFEMFAYSIYLLIIWVFFFIEWTDYYLDVWVITDRRIVDIEQKGFFHREITSFNYEQIQDITIETRGFIETLFRFGTLHVQTAGSGRDILINHAANPEEARLLILGMQKKFAASKNGL